MTLPYFPLSAVKLGRPLTDRGLGYGFSGVGLGEEYGTLRPGVSSVMEMANVDCSGWSENEFSGILAGGTGI